MNTSHQDQNNELSKPNRMLKGLIELLEKENDYEAD